jgi:predicted flap endonuclease-1-like 5' DNA nuclease
MNVIAMFILGLLIGWLAEWAIDWFHWRGQIRAIANENTALRERITSLEKKKDTTRLSAKGIPLTDKDGNDNFQAIKGIGPVFAKRLKEAGVTTFEQLSRLTSRELEAILGALYKRFFSRQETILAQAQEYARQRAQKK